MVVLGAVLITLPGLVVQSRAALFDRNGLKIFADARARLEADWDSRTATAIARDDRTRIRVRLRAGLEFRTQQNLTVGLRLRTGSDLGQQSPHITIIDFDDNPTGAADFNLDRWFVQINGKKSRGWFGRNDIPWWHQNELFWDDDVTVAGLAYIFSHPVAPRSTLTLNLGYFSLPAGMRAFSGNLGLAQVVVEGGTRPGYAVSLGLMDIAANPGDAANAIYLQQNGERDYRSWIASAQMRCRVGSLPLTLGGDVVHNSENYSPTDSDPLTAANFDQTDGWVVSARIGSRKEKGEWEAGYYYSEIELFAVNNSFSEDDWVRWGNADQTRASDMRGHELRGTYVLAPNRLLTARLYLARAITTMENGKRLRLDYDIKF